MVLLTLAPVPKQQFSDQNGVPLPGALIEFFASGTSTHLTAYSDSAGSVALSNPASCDAGGYLTYYLTSAAYKITVSTSAGVLLYTVDPVSAVPVTQVALDVEGTAGESLAANDAVYLSAGDGGRTNGRWYKTDATNAYSSTTATSLGIVPNAIASGASGTIRQAGRVTGFGGLTAGSLYYLSGTTPGAITTSAPANARAIGTADSATTLILSSFIPVPPASATLAGIVSLGTQTLGTGTKTVDGLVVNSQPTAKQGTSATANITVGGVIFADTGPRANSGAGETDLSSHSLLANSLSANSKGIKIYAWGTCANSAGSKIIRLYFGATSLLGTLATLTASTAAERWYVEAIIQRRDATNQRAIGHVQTDENGLAVVNRINPTSPAETLSGAVTVKSTGTAAGGAVNDIVQEGFGIEALG